MYGQIKYACILEGRLILLQLLYNVSNLIIWVRGNFLSVFFLSVESAGQTVLEREVEGAEGKVTMKKLSQVTRILNARLRPLGYSLVQGESSRSDMSVHECKKKLTRNMVKLFPPLLKTGVFSESS